MTLYISALTFSKLKGLSFRCLKLRPSKEGGRQARFTGGSTARRAVFPSRGCQSLSRESCAGICLHTPQQESCLSPSPDFFMLIKSSSTFLSSPCCSSPLGCSAAGSKEWPPEKHTCPWVEFPGRTALLINLYSPLLFLSLDLSFEVEEILHQGQSSSCLYHDVVCMLGDVQPRASWWFSTIPHTGPRVGNSSTGGEYQLPEKAKLIVTLHPSSHHRC